MDVKQYNFTLYFSNNRQTKTYQNWPITMGNIYMSMSLTANDKYHHGKADQLILWTRVRMLSTDKHFSLDFEEVFPFPSPLFQN